MSMTTMNVRRHEAGQNPQTNNKDEIWVISKSVFSPFLMSIIDEHLSITRPSMNSLWQ